VKISIACEPCRLRKHQNIPLAIGSGKNAMLNPSTDPPPRERETGRIVPKSPSLLHTENAFHPVTHPFSPFSPSIQSTAFIVSIHPSLNPHFKCIYHPNSPTVWHDDTLWNLCPKGPKFPIHQTSNRRCISRSSASDDDEKKPLQLHVRSWL
jgi:hypothetical protein